MTIADRMAWSFVVADVSVARVFTTSLRSPGDKLEVNSHLQSSSNRLPRFKTREPATSCGGGGERVVPTKCTVPRAPEQCVPRVRAIEGTKCRARKKKAPVGPARVPTGASGNERVVSQAAHDRCRRLNRRRREGGVHRVLPTTLPGCESCNLPAMGNRPPNPGGVMLDFKPSLRLAFGDDRLRRPRKR
jgi:hypothetical protein